MSLPKDWYDDHDGQSLVLNPERVAQEFESLLTALKRLVNDSMFKDHPEASQMAIDAIARVEARQMSDDLPQRLRAMANDLYDSTGETTR